VPSTDGPSVPAPPVLRRRSPHGLGSPASMLPPTAHLRSRPSAVRPRQDQLPRFSAEPQAACAPHASARQRRAPAPHVRPLRARSCVPLTPPATSSAPPRRQRPRAPHARAAPEPAPLRAPPLASRRVGSRHCLEPPVRAAAAAAPRVGAPLGAAATAAWSRTKEKRQGKKKPQEEALPVEEKISARDKKNRGGREIEFPKDLCVNLENYRDLSVKHKFSLI
jgi:hypothetical protein